MKGGRILIFRKGLEAIMGPFSTSFSRALNFCHAAPASNLEQDMSQAISWFKTNQMVANPSKFQVMLLGLKTDDSIVLDIGNVSIDVVSSVKLLGITIDSKLKFDQHGQHVAKLCQKANNKISAFSRISHYLNEKQSRLL